MALSASKVSSNPASTNMASLPKSHGALNSFSKSLQQDKFHFTGQSGELRQLSRQCLSKTNLCFTNDVLWRINGKTLRLTASRRPSTFCQSRGTKNSETKGGLRTCDDCADTNRWERIIFMFKIRNYLRVYSFNLVLVHFLDYSYNFDLIGTLSSISHNTKLPIGCFRSIFKLEKPSLVHLSFWD